MIRNNALTAGQGNSASFPSRLFYCLFLIGALSLAGWAAEPAAPPVPAKPTLDGQKAHPRKTHKKYYKRFNKVQPVEKAGAVSSPGTTPAEVTAETNREQSPSAPAAAAPISRGQQQPAKIDSVRRRVEFRKSGEERWQKAAANKSLQTQDEIRTGKQSMARLKLADGSKLLLLQNSSAEMEDLSSLQKAIKILRGRIRAIVSKIHGEGSFKIKTPIGVASVRGTDFEVEYDEDARQMYVDVRKGAVGVAKLGDLAGEVVVHPGERLRFGLEGEIGDPIKMGAVPMTQMDVRTEVVNAQAKDRVVSMAAEESRNADYQVGKSMIDVDGKRVRIEEYIMRPAPDTFKLVVLNQRSTRFDYFYYKGTFNTTLPTDLSVALGQVGGKLNAEPDYWLKDSEMYMSNTHDSIKDVSSGGHLVQIYFDGTNYTLTTEGNERVIAAAQVQGDGSYKIYNPIRDTFSLVGAADKNEAVKLGVNDGGTYRNMISGDTYWKSRFDKYDYYINDRPKTAYVPSVAGVPTLAIDLDATWTNPAIVTKTEYPSGSGTLYNRLSLFYANGSKTVFDNYIIDDEGNVAPSSRFAGLATSAAYQNELVKWNYQQKVKADEMSDSINLVVDPRIGVMSGLMQ